MQDNGFDPNLLKQVAGAMAQSFSENAQNDARDQKIIQELSSKVDNAQTLTCDACGHHVFQKGTVLKRFSQISSPTGQEVVVPVEVFSCAKCGGVNEEFLPSYAISDIKKFDENGLPTY